MSEPVTLFEDQSALVARTTQAMRTSKAVLLQSATGSGKTRMAAHMIQRAVAKGNRAGFMAPRRELVRQTSETMREFGINHGFVASGHKSAPFSPVQVMTSGTLSRRLDRAPKLNVLFIDECHFGGAELDRIIAYYKSMGTWIIGLSATPLKTNGKGMGEWYDTLIDGPQVGWLMDNNRLSKYRMFGPDTPDFSAVKVSNGDYAKGQINDYMMSDERGKVIVGNAAKHYKDNAYGKRNVSFCTSVKHAEMTADMFNDRGIPSAAVSGSMDDAELRRITVAFAKGEIMNLCNAQLLCFGWDLEQASGMKVTVESMSDLSPTKSLPWIMQKWGRVLRMKPDPALIFDHVGNFQEHGHPDSDREWSLEGRDKSKRGEMEKTEPTRQCSECYMVHRPSPECPSCGHVYPNMGRDIEEIEGELVEVESAPKVNKKQEVGMIARTDGLKGLQEYAKANGYKPTWAAMQMRMRGLPVR